MKTILLCLLAVLLAAACRPEPEAPVRSAASLDSAETAPPTPETGLVISFPRVAAAIRSGVQSGRARFLERSSLVADRTWLNRLYNAETYAPLWVNVAGQPTMAARDAIAAMQSATEEGLDSLDYSAARLAEAAAAIDSVKNPDPDFVGGFDLALSTAFLRYVRHLHSGRVVPTQIGFQLRLPEDRHDVPAMIRTALADGTVPQLVLSQRPPLVQYTRVKETLARYRPLADSISDPVPEVKAAVKPGEPWAGTAALRRRLALLGDLTDTREAPVPSDTGTEGEGVPLTGVPEKYEGALVEGVKRFQDRHGLAADGVIGRGTIAALNVPIRRRVAQLELSMERLRWLPDLTGDRFILVNIPTFQLWAWDSLGAEETPSLTMHVIVGQKALSMQTPILEERMEFVIFRPYWNVPPGILRNEILPALQQNPDYLRRNDMEVVQGQGDDAKAVPLDDDALELLERGQLRVRQRPGPRNSLGLVKFMFPNDENVYLHGTPAQELFSRTRRDFSHGCVRVEGPVELAEWVLKGLPEWDRTSIIEAMHAGKSTQVNLDRPIAVILFYTTAIVDADGSPLFYDDIYGHDQKLLQALSARSR